MQEVQGLSFFTNAIITCTPYKLVFQATAFHYPPRTVMKEDRAGNSIAIGGYEYLIFDTISEKLK